MSGDNLVEQQGQRNLLISAFVGKHSVDGGYRWLAFGGFELIHEDELELGNVE